MAQGCPGYRLSSRGTAQLDPCRRIINGEHLINPLRPVLLSDLGVRSIGVGILDSHVPLYF